MTARDCHWDAEVAALRAAAAKLDVLLDLSQVEIDDAPGAPARGSGSVIDETAAHASTASAAPTRSNRAKLARATPWVSVTCSKTSHPRLLSIRNCVAQSPQPGWLVRRRTGGRVDRPLFVTDPMLNTHPYQIPYGYRSGH